MTRLEQAMAKRRTHERRKDRALMAAVLQWNAEIRAWKAFGLPVGGRWRLGLPEDAFAPDDVYIGAHGFLRCEAGCHHPRPEGFWVCVSDWVTNYEYRRAMDESAAEILARYGCTHLTPILSAKKPRGFRGVVALELLAGDAP